MGGALLISFLYVFYAGFMFDIMFLFKVQCVVPISDSCFLGIDSSPGMILLSSIHFLFSSSEDQSQCLTRVRQSVPSQL